jgi:hypothetical protein
MDLIGFFLLLYGWFVGLHFRRLKGPARKQNPELEDEFAFTPG